MEIARDLSIVLLALETAVFVLAIGAALYYAVRGVRVVKRWVRLPLLNAQVWTLRIQRGTQRTTNAMIELPIAAHSASARVRATVRALGDGLLGR